MFDSLIQKAVSLATESHRKQYRKRTRGGVRMPYITHPLEVLKMIWEWETVDEITAVAAVLHDTLEDTDLKLEEIKEHFNDKIASIVQELTFAHPQNVSKVEADRLKAEYMLSFQDKSINALAIKVADRLANVMDFYLTDPKYAKVYFQKASGLFVILKQRLPEIEKEWGEKSAQNLLKSLDEVTTLMYK